MMSCNRPRHLNSSTKFIVLFFNYLVVTHEKALVNRFAKRVVAIENGRIISDETGGYYNGEKV